MPTDRPVSRPALPAAVSTLVAAVLQGERVAATVLAAHRYALYLSVRGSVLPVVTSDAAALPTAVRLAAPAGAVSWGVGVGDEVLVGGGRIALPGFDVVAARTWRPSRVRHVVAAGGCSDGRRGSHLPTHLELSGAGEESGWLADGIRQALSTHREVGAAVAGLVGRGAGLTPSGDDALAGALLVAHALGAGEPLAAAVRARLGATTAVSAALLDAAADGYAARPVVTLVDGAVAGDPGAARRALPAVLAIGHTSGADTVTGIRAALDTFLAETARTTSTGRSAA
jgi:Protein of unknown function (DUF2877)